MNLGIKCLILALWIPWFYTLGRFFSRGVTNTEQKNIFHENPVEVRSFDGTVFSEKKKLDFLKVKNLTDSKKLLPVHSWWGQERGYVHFIGKSIILLYSRVH